MKLTRTLVRAVSTLLVSGALALTSTPVQAQDLHGAMAFSKNSDGSFAGAIAWNHGSRVEARQRSVVKCRGEGGEECRAIVSFREACGAIAVGDIGGAKGYGAGWGATFEDAEGMAVSWCRKSGNAGCRVEISRCVEPEAAFALTREQRRRVQAALAAQGTKPGPADGVFGPKTRAAVTAWQSAKGYSATGKLTAGQVRELLGPGVQTARATSAAGSVATVQRPAATVKQAKADPAEILKLINSRFANHHGYFCCTSKMSWIEDGELIVYTYDVWESYAIKHGTGRKSFVVRKDVRWEAGGTHYRTEYGSNYFEYAFFIDQVKISLEQAADTKEHLENSKLLHTFYGDNTVRLQFDCTVSSECIQSKDDEDEYSYFGAMTVIVPQHAGRSILRLFLDLQSISS